MTTFTAQQTIADLHARAVRLVAFFNTEAASPAPSPRAIATGLADLAEAFAALIVEVGVHKVRLDATEKRVTHLELAVEGGAAS